MMDAASDDPIEMIATLARGMMAERRGRFLDAACGGDANLRAEVEARLGDVPKNDGADEQPSGALADQVVNPELDSIESIALEALSEVPGPNESQPAESRNRCPGRPSDRRLLRPEATGHACPAAAFSESLSGHRPGPSARLDPRRIDSQAHTGLPRWLPPGDPAGTVSPAGRGFLQTCIRQSRTSARRARHDGDRCVSAWSSPL